MRLVRLVAGNVGVAGGDGSVTPSGGALLFVRNVGDPRDSRRRLRPASLPRRLVPRPAQHVERHAHAGDRAVAPADQCTTPVAPLATKARGSTGCGQSVPWRLTFVRLRAAQIVIAKASRTGEPVQAGRMRGRSHGWRHPNGRRTRECADSLSEFHKEPIGACKTFAISVICNINRGCRTSAAPLSKGA
jgi:hypothetical protein